MYSEGCNENIKDATYIMDNYMAIIFGYQHLSWRSIYA